MNTQYAKEFVKIGAMASGGGPLILAIIYAILMKQGVLTTLPVEEVILGMSTSLVLAFISGGISVLYRIESLPLMWATLLHAVVLYLDYLIIYLINGWLPQDLLPILIFTGCFAGGYFLIWSLIYASIKRSANHLNQKFQV